MHPNKFFSDVQMISNTMIQGGLKPFLASAHPKNFICPDIHLPVYRILIHYTLPNGNYKEVERYAILPPPYEHPESIDEWVQMMVTDYLMENQKEWIDWGVDGIEKLGTAVLKIG